MLGAGTRPRLLLYLYGGEKSRESYRILEKVLGVWKWAIVGNNIFGEGTGRIEGFDVVCYNER